MGILPMLKLCRRGRLRYIHGSRQRRDATSPAPHLRTNGLSPFEGGRVRRC